MSNEISLDMIKSLREKTGLGIMEVKAALKETDGNEEEAIRILRERGKARMVKRQDRVVRQGIIHSYIHFNKRVGSLIELNCETDFVANTKDFKDLAEEIAEQVVAASPLAIKRENLDPEIVEAEKDIYRKQMENEKKPANIIEKIIEGKLDKYYEEVVLMEQKYFKDEKMTVKDLLDEIQSKTGEVISVGKIARFELNG
ncbi:MAG: elongation factor Ts [Candidatus Coatesbacteria bacterium]|nr:elongation factor Ts [Candidatus Coatesbacteria bacterium]